MTLLEINLTDVLSETDPDDRVIVWAPVLREGPAGQLVGPRRKSIPLTDGVGSDEVVPGPLMVQVQCKAMSDTRPREVVVPETGPVTLTALFDSSGAFTYSPAVMGQVAQYRNEAIQAAADAGLSATAAATSETNAAGHATQTADDRRQTGEDRTQTGLDRQAAAQSATDAATSATTAEGHKTTVQTALAGARLYSGTGFPNGVVAAPVGSIYTDTAATNGAIRWIKTSGTGNTGWQVEYGDTGLRKLAAFHTDGTLTNYSGDSDPAGFTSYSDTVEGGLWVRRANQKVTYYLRGKTTGAQTIQLPSGMRPDGNPYQVTTIPYSYTASQSAAVGGNTIYMAIPTGTTVPTLSAAYTSAISFDTYLPWPTILPGIPA